MTANLDRHVAAMAADPGDPTAFATLEEAYFLAGDWDKLVALYRQRLSDPNLEAPAERAPIHYRLGQILEERCLDIDLAIEQYTQAVQIDSSYGPALRQLRQVHARREAWDMVLQIAELEIETLTEPYERAVFFAEMGDVWLRHVGDASEAMTCFEQALSIDANQKEALAGLARTLETQGNPEGAAAIWERLIGNVRGPDRATPLVALAGLLSGPLRQGERAVELYRRALGDDPRNEAAVEALSVSAAARGQWDLLTDLFERRFSLAAGARRRTAIALEAGYTQLEQLHNVSTARVWFERAGEMSSDDTTVIAAFVDLEREAGDDDKLASALDRLIASLGASTPLRYLLEAAGLHTERANDERALACLEYAERQAPDDGLVLESLCATYQALQRHDDVAAVLERRAAGCEADPHEHTTLLIELGYVQAAQLADLDAAIDAYERAFAVSPSRPGLAATLESLYRKTESWQSLRGLLERAADGGPEADRPGFYCSLGELLEEHFDDLEASALCFEASLDLAPSPRALQALSRLATRSGDPDAMLRALEREAAAVTDPERLATICLDLCERREQSGDLEAALSWAERMLGAAPGSREGLETTARIQEKLGRHDDLTRTLSDLDELQSGAEQAATRARIATLHEMQGDDDAAIGWWQSTLESRPDDLAALTALRRHYLAENRFEDVVPVLRRLADGSPGEAQVGYLDELAQLLDERLCDVDGAIVVLWRLSGLPGRPDDVGNRLEHLLERAGRFEELAQQLLERRRSLPDDSEEALEVDLRRATLMLDPLAQFEDAVLTFRAVRLRAPEREEATRGLERALRAANDYGGLARLLEEIADDAPDADGREALLFERAVLLEESLEELEQARQAYARLCTPDTSAVIAAEAGARLESLLERCGDWTALRDRLAANAERAEGPARIALHDRIAQLCTERMKDPSGAVLHLEESGRLDASRAHPWRTLAALYQQLSRPEDLLRVILAELETGPDPERERVLRARAAELWAARPGEEARACEHFERLLELDPGRADASEFLVDQYEASDRFADVVRLLEGRLAAICEATADVAGDDPSRGLQTSLRLRIATLRSEELDDAEGAIRLLEAALETDGPTGPAVEPLVELYEATGRSAERAGLCRSVSQACSDPGERALWLHRLAHCLREARDDDGAIEAYQEVLSVRPDDVDAQAALRDLYRRGEHAAPLVVLLEASLAGATPSEQIPIRMELAQLLESQLARPVDALAQLHDVIALEGDHDAAFQHAIDLAHRMESYDTEVELIDTRLARTTSTEERVDLLERRAGLLANELAAPEAAVAAYREVIALAPERRSARRSMREVLEALGRWTSVLDCLYVDAQSADPSEQARIYERAAEIATANVGQDAALPWLERLRAVRPKDALIVARIADVHRMAGRFESVLRALEDELDLTTDPSHARDLHVGGARILERDMNAPGRAITSLECARKLFPRDPEVLAKLDDLYAQTGRARERAEVIEQRLEHCSDEDRLRLHLSVADLYANRLTSPDLGVPHLLRAVHLTGAASGSAASGNPSTPEARIALLSDLATTLRAAGWDEAWTRASEAELALQTTDLEQRPADEDDPRIVRRNVLQRELAWTYADRLADPNAALRHLRSIQANVDEDAAAGLSAQDLDDAELRLIDLLRREANHVELEERLTTRVARGKGDADDWLELARLRDERLHAPAAARDAYAESLALRPTCVHAIRGLRDLSERLGDWREVARALDLEHSLEEQCSTRQQALLARRLGDVYWRRIHDEDRAIAAYADALASEPRDLESLRALQQLHEMHDALGTAAELYEREAGILGDDDTARRIEVWLAAAELHRRDGNAAARALDAYDHADALSPLSPEARRRQADLYAEVGDRENFAASYASWCDDPDSDASCSDHLLLVETLIELSRPDEAIERCRRALDVDEDSADAWATLAALLEEDDQAEAAADAWEQAGERRQGGDAAAHLRRAALLVETHEPGRCADRLRRALECDPASAAANADLARVACNQESFEEAESAAIRALDLSAAVTESGLDADAQLATAMAGGAAARALDRLESAVLFYGVALDLDPSNREALEAYGELLFERGDLAAARGALEARLEMGPDDREAERRAMLGNVLELAGQPDEALASFRQAVASDESCGTAHAGIARLCEKAGDIDDAVTALASWADACRSAGDLHACAARHLRAAELEIAREHAESARSQLQKSLDASLDNARAWVLLAEIHAETEDLDELMRLVPEALVVDAVNALPDAVARLSLLYARALERTGDMATACEAYAEAVRHDPRCAEAALSRAKLLRLAGDWQEAADGLRDFCIDHPEPDHRDLAEVQYKLARLLSGPLEDMSGAILCFERALQIAPDHPKTRAPLASLLAVMPDRWDQAAAQHATLLEGDPARAQSIRGLIQIARGRGDEDASRFGLALLRAIGAASPDERDLAPDCIPTPVLSQPTLADPSYEVARRLLQHAAEALDQVLHTPAAAAEGERQDADFVTLRDDALRDLACSGLERFSDDELGDLLITLAGLALGDEADQEPIDSRLDATIASGIEGSLGRWTRRKMRRVLDGTSLNQIRGIDPGSFRRALRGLAAGVALDIRHGDLRSALTTLCASDDAATLSEGDDLTQRISASADAQELLRCVSSVWCARMSRS